METSSNGSDEAVRVHRHVWTLAVRFGNKLQYPIMNEYISL